MNAKVSEIFVSYQGEGPYAGSRQLFVRFFGCNMACGYCDTRLDSYKSFTREGLLGKIMDFEDDYNELAITGGEPLLQAEFLDRFLPLYKKHRPQRIYLETNGTRYREFAAIKKHVDIVSMDIKLPSTDPGKPDYMDDHERFLAAASSKELIVKAVVSDTTAMDDIKRMAFMLSGMDGDICVVLQPVTPINGLFRTPDGEMLQFFKGHIAKETGKDVMVMGQLHKKVGIR